MKIRTPLALASLALAGFLGGCAATGETCSDGQTCASEKNGACCSEGASAGKACCAEGAKAEGAKAQPAAK